MRPLENLTVVEFEGIGPAPLAGMMMADMGANVILVERKSSNPNAGLNKENQRNSADFVRRGKEAITLDLKKPDDIKTAMRLIEKADVLIEGFRPGVMEKLGLGPDVCTDKNPGLVYGRLTGWGQTGPLRHLAGHDPNYAAITGVLSTTIRKNNSAAPTAPLTMVGDVMGGTMMLLWGIMCALNSRQQTNKGQVVDASMVDGACYGASLLWMMRAYNMIGDTVESGWADGAAPFNDAYECADGKYVTICSLEPQFYTDLVTRLDLKDHPVFANQWDTSAWPEGKEILRNIFLGKTQEEWCEELEQTDVCFAPVLTFGEALQHPQNIARGNFAEIDGIAQPNPAPKLSAYSPNIGPVPEIGEHTDMILASLEEENSKS